LFSLINEELNTAAKSIDVLLIMGLKEVFLQGFKATYNELKLKQLLNKMKVPISVGTVTPYAYETMQNYFNTYKTPFMKGWQDEQKTGIFKIIEEQALKGYNYGTAASNMKKMFGENPYGIGNAYYWKMVARTEGARVFTEASVKAAKDLEFEYKKVVVTQGCDTCWNMEAEGWIPIGQQFSMGDIPFHPHCMCHYDYKKEKESWSEADEYSQKEIDTMGQELMEYKEKQLNALNQKIEDTIEEYDRTGKLDIERFTDEELKTLDSFRRKESWKINPDGTSTKIVDDTLDKIRKSLDEYKGNMYEVLNKWLREGQPDDFYDPYGNKYSWEFIDDLKILTQRIDDALDKSGLHKDTLMYRGISANIETKFIASKGALYDRGFESWTTDLYTAEKFVVRESGQDYLLLKQVAPKGLKTVFLEKEDIITAKVHLDNTGKAGWESEFLLGRNYKQNTIKEEIFLYQDLFPKSDKLEYRKDTKVKVRTVILTD